MSKDFRNNDQGRQHVEKLDRSVKFQETVQAFLEIHDQLEGKYWPMVDLFVEHLEAGIPAKKIAKSFYRAYMNLKGLTSWMDIPNYFYKTIGRVQVVALLGRKGINVLKSKMGFWSVVEMAKIASENRKIGGMSKAQGKSRLRDKHFNYFLYESPGDFGMLFSIFTDEVVNNMGEPTGRLPNLERDPMKEFKQYEKMCIKLLGRLLNNPNFFFSPKYNWPLICHQITEQIKPKHPVIMDVETQTL